MPSRGIRKSRKCARAPPRVGPLIIWRHNCDLNQVHDYDVQVLSPSTQYITFHTKTIHKSKRNDSHRNKLHEEVDFIKNSAKLATHVHYGHNLTLNNGWWFMFPIWRLYWDGSTHIFTAILKEMATLTENTILKYILFRIMISLQPTIFLKRIHPIRLSIHVLAVIHNSALLRRGLSIIPDSNAIYMTKLSSWHIICFFTDGLRPVPIQPLLVLTLNIFSGGLVQR